MYALDIKAVKPSVTMNNVERRNWKNFRSLHLKNEDLLFFSENID